MIRAACLCVSVAILLALIPAPAPAQQSEVTAVKSGQAAAKFGGKDFAFPRAKGTFQQVQGFTEATLIFEPAVKAGADTPLLADTFLNLALRYRGPGKVDLDSASSTSGLRMSVDDDVAQFTRGKSKCSITLTKATPTDVEGTVECPLLHDIEGKVMPALTVQKFSASTR